MSVDFATQTIDLPLYTITFAAEASADTIVLTVTCDHKFDPAGDNRSLASVGVVANGLGGPDKFPLVAAWGGPYPPHTFVNTADGWRTTQVYTIVRSAVPHLLAAGPCDLYCNVITNFGQAAPPICCVNLGVDLPPRPLPALAAGTVLRALFWAFPEGVEADGGAATLHAAGVNCVHGPAFLSPGDNPTLGPDLGTYQANWTSLVLPKYQWARANNFKMFLIGDDFFRNQQEKDWINNTPWAADAVTWVGQQIAAFADAIVGIEMQDEAPDTASDPAYQLVIDALRAGWPAVPMSWPNQFPQANETPSRATYASRYWNVDGILENGVATVGEQAVGLARAADRIPAGWPFVCQVGAMGAFYTKRAEGNDYRPGVDTLQKGATRAITVPAQVWAALANGASALRCYAYDYPAARDRRSTSPVGTADLETGTKPGDDRWAALSAAFNSVASREAKLLAGFRPPIRQGNWLLGFRDGLSWAVNLSERSEDCAPGDWQLVTPAGEVAFAGGSVPPGGVVIRDDA